MEEFQPVIMAGGRGSRMTELTCECPKALLPVGNMPMIWYPIIMLEKAGFEDAIVIVPERFLPEFQKMPEICEVKMDLEFVGIPETEYLGTADSLRRIADKIKTDVLVISCDLITDVSIHKLANIHRKYDSSLSMLLSPLPNQFTEIPAPGVKSKKKTERDFIGFDESGDRVLFTAAEADLDETVTFRKSLLKKHPFINIKSNLTDCHMYILKKWVIDYLAENEQISTINGDLIPYIVKKQCVKPKKIDTNITDLSLTSTPEVKKDIASYVSDDNMNVVVRDLSTWLDHRGDMADCFHDDRIRCYAFRQEEGFCVRTNTLGTYFETNKQIAKYLLNIFPKEDIGHMHTTVTVKEKSQIGNDCMVGEGTTIGEKVSIKRSIIGKHCRISDKVKIANCVVMDHVTISESCNMTGSIIGNNAEINERAELKDCVVSNGQSIKASGKFINESIADTSRMMDIS